MSSPNASTPDALSITRKPDDHDIDMTDAEAVTPAKVQKVQSSASRPAALSTARRKTSSRDLIMASPTDVKHPGALQEKTPRRVNSSGEKSTPRGTHSEPLSAGLQQQQRAFAAITALSGQRDEQSVSRATGPPLPRLGGTLVLGEGQGTTSSYQRKQAVGASNNLPLYQPPPQQHLGGTPSSALRQSAPQQHASIRSPAPSINIAALSQQLAAEGKPPLTPKSLAGINKVLQGFERITKHMVEEEGMSSEHAAWTWEVIRRRGIGVEIDWEEEGRKRNEMIARQKMEREKVKEREGRVDGGEGGDSGRSG